MENGNDSKRKPNGQFSEGHKFAKGGKFIPQDLKEARKLNSEQVERVVNKMLHWSLVELKEFCQDEQNEVFECLIASILGKAIHQGDPLRLDFVLNILRLKPKTIEADQKNLHKEIVDMIHQIEHKNGGNHGN